MAKVSVSILNADYGHLQEFVNKVHNADALQFDVMDGHFVPNLTMGPALAGSIRTKLEKEAHLMVTNPSLFVRPFAQAGMDRLIFHVEVRENKDKVIRAIRAQGMQAGMAISMKTPIRRIMPYLKKLDMVIVMPITPGFGGQKFDPRVLGKIRAVRKVSGIDIQVDGGINAQTARMCVEAGATNLLAGTFITRSRNPHATVEMLKRI